MLHAIPDFATFLCCMSILLVFVYVYQTGRISKLKSAYPSLWVLSGGFIGTHGLSRLGAFFEIWYGGNEIYWWLTGANKILMAVVSWVFFFELLRQSNRLILTGKVLFEVEEEQKKIDLEETETYSDARH